MPDLLFTALREMGVPRLIIWAVIMAVAIGSLVATASMASFSVGMHAEDISNRLANVQEDVGKFRGQISTLTDEVRDLRHDDENISKLIAGLDKEFDDERRNVADRFDRNTKWESDSGSRLAAIEASASIAQTDAARLTNEFHAYLMQHHAEIGHVEEVK